MQSIATEMNLSETAFIVPRNDDFGLRWFTPATEVDLCGHATLASAHTLWETGRLTETATAKFHTRSGLLTAKQAGDWIELDFPVTPAEAIEAPAGLSDLLGSVPKFVGRSRFDLLMELSDAEELRDLNPDFAGLSRFPVRGFIVTAPSDVPEYDFLSRFFAPAECVNEDPVTGSAHCCLAPFWAGRLGRDELSGFQASQRGGVVCCEVVCDRVELSGRAVKIFSGTMNAPPAGA